MQSKQYPVKDYEVGGLLVELEHFFRGQSHEVQVLQVDNTQVLQAQKETALGALTGLSSAITVKIIPEANGIRVEIGSSKWIDKAAVGVIGYVIMPVLAIIPLVGAYNQYRLTEDAWHIVDAFMARKQPQPRSSAPPPHSWAQQSPPPSQAMQSCPDCGSALAPNAAFCSSCGSQLLSLPTCKKCGITNQRGARFCSGCGDRFD